MGENKQLRVRFRWSEVAFAVIWIGSLSIYWIQIKMNVHFQALLGLGIGLSFPMSLVYVSVIYIAAVTGILWAGLGIYLATAGRLRQRKLMRGLLVILLVVVPSLLAELFLKGLSLPPLLHYMTQWLPLFLALWLSMWVWEPQHQRNVPFR